MDKFELHGRQIRASFGTTKYCSYFIKGQECQNKECLYVHTLVPEEDTLPKEKVCNNRSLFNDQQKTAYQLACVDTTPVAQFILEMRPFAAHGTPVLPPPSAIYTRPFYFLKQRVSVSPARYVYAARSSTTLGESSPAKNPVELTPKEVRRGDAFEIPLFRLASADYGKTESGTASLTQRLVRARESRFSFAKAKAVDDTEDSEEGFGEDLPPSFSAEEELLYNAARQELVRSEGKEDQLPSDKGLDEDCDKLLKPEEDEGLGLELDKRWIKCLLKEEGARRYPGSATKINAAFDGNAAASFGLLYSYVKMQAKIFRNSSRAQMSRRMQRRRRRRRRDIIWKTGGVLRRRVGQQKLQSRGR